MSVEKEEEEKGERKKSFMNLVEHPCCSTWLHSKGVRWDYVLSGEADSGNAQRWTLVVEFM